MFFIYDLSSFMVRVEQYSVPFSSFFTSVCALIGGVLTVAGVVDSLLYHGTKRLAKAGSSSSTASASAPTASLLTKLTAAKAGPSSHARSV